MTILRWRYNYDCHFSPSHLTYFQSAASYCLTATRPQSSNTNSMDSNCYTLTTFREINIWLYLLDLGKEGKEGRAGKPPVETE